MPLGCREAGEGKGHPVATGFLDTVLPGRHLAEPAGMWEGTQIVLVAPNPSPVCPPFFFSPPQQLTRNHGLTEQDGVQCFSGEMHRPPASESVETLV